MCEFVNFEEDCLDLATQRVAWGSVSWDVCQRHGDVLKRVITDAGELPVWIALELEGVG